MASAIVKYMLKADNVIHVRQVILTYSHPIQRDVTIVAVLPWEQDMGILRVIHLLVFVTVKTMLEVCMKFSSNKNPFNRLYYHKDWNTKCLHILLNNLITTMVVEFESHS